jgi:hypothetical protein
MSGEVEQRDGTICVAHDRLNDQPDLRRLPVLRNDIIRQARRARIDTNAGDEPRRLGLSFARKANAIGGASDAAGGAGRDADELLEHRIGPNRVVSVRILRIRRSDVRDRD